MKKKNLVLGLTIRKWFNGKRQNELENSYIKAIIKLSGKMKIIVQPIVQVNAPEYGENDLIITKRMYRKLKANQVKVLRPIIISGLKNSLSIYSKIDLLLGMRMHSNIIASILGKPFIAISYEHKTEGISHQLGLDNYCIKSTEVNGDNLYKMLNKAFINRVNIGKQITASINNIRRKETTRWQSIISNNLFS